MSSAPIVRSALRPALLLFVIPLFAWWFSGHAAGRYDAQVLEQFTAAIQADTSLSMSDRAQALAFFTQIPASLACADSGPELAAYRADLDSVCSDYAQFAWMRRIALLCIGAGLAAALAGLLTALLAHRARRAQVPAFVAGWNVLRIVGAIEVAGQGALVVFLSFWMTALWFERYYVKLIIVAGALALFGIVAVVMAIFRRPPEGLDVEGEVLDGDRAPELWERLRTLSSTVGTTPPDNLVVGIDDNFFVTEAEVRVADRVLTGRTLYLSLSLLRVLERAEADAVFGHEMAHLLGGDTARSRMLAPHMSRFAQYLGALEANLLTRPVYLFMDAWGSIFHLAVARDQRLRELEADAVAAKATSPMEIARSLLKVGAFSRYRARVESSLFEADAVHAELGIAHRIAVGFADYARSEQLAADMTDAVTPHPYDSHPPLRDRLANVGAELPADDYAECLLDPVASSWVESIPDAQEIEGRLWAAYEARFAAAHDLALAYRYTPANDEERRHVEKYFPPVEFAAKGGGTLVLDFEKAQAPGWSEAIPFAAIESARIEDKYTKKYLVLKPREAGLFTRNHSICVSDFPGSADAIIAAFNRYFGRHLQVRQQQELRKAG